MEQHSAAQGMRDRIIRGDCIEVMRDMPTGSVDFVLTDPPYIAHYRDRSGRSVANDDNGAWLAPAFREAARVLKDNRFCVSFYGWPQADRFLAAWRDAGLRPVGHLVWVKFYHSNREPRFLKYRHEAAYLLAKGSPRPTRVINDVLAWEYSGNRLHPTEKAVGTMGLLIESYSRPGDTVLDPFAGSGTSAVAARELGRHYIGIELDPRHAETARMRLAAKVAPKNDSDYHHG